MPLEGIKRGAVLQVLGEKIEEKVSERKDRFKAEKRKGFIQGRIDLGKRTKGL